ncbi:MAG: hypothetical protein R3F61_31365 [Myxococcota bacterium]
MRLSLLLALTALVACSQDELAASDDATSAWGTKIQFDGGTTGKSTPSLNTEICDNQKDDDGDGLVDEDCDDGINPGKPPGYGTTTGDGPSTFYPWDDYWFFDSFETVNGERLFIAGGGETEASFLIDDNEERLLELQERGNGEALFAALARVDGEGMYVQTAFGAREEVWMLVMSPDTENAWALGGESMGLLYDAPEYVPERRYRR